MCRARPCWCFPAAIRARRKTAAGSRTWITPSWCARITRYARTVREPSLVLQELDEAISRAFGEGGEPGPSYIDFPTDTLRGIVPKALQLDEHLDAEAARGDAARPGSGRTARSIYCGRRGACSSYPDAAPAVPVPN